jgi:hypothetical protein
VAVPSGRDDPDHLRRVRPRLFEHRARHLVARNGLAHDRRVLSGSQLVAAARCFAGLVRPVEPSRAGDVMGVPSAQCAATVFILRCAPGARLAWPDLPAIQMRLVAQAALYA